MRGGEAMREGVTAFHPRGTRLMACLKMAGPPAAQVSKGGERAGIQGQQRPQGHQGRARRDLMRPRSQSAGNKGRARYGTHGT